jgi:hypothetical protein
LPLGLNTPDRAENRPAEPWSPQHPAYVGVGSSTEMLRLSITGLLFMRKADAGVEVPVCQLSAINRHDQNLFDDLGGDGL